MSEHACHTPGVVMFVMNDLLNDPRVQREARSAVRAGFRVTVIALQSDRSRVGRETVDGYEVVRVRYHRSLLWFLLGRLLWLCSLVVLVLAEGFKMAVGLPPGPQASGQDPSPPSRWRRVKWALMRMTGTLLLPARVLRPFLGRRIQKLQQSPQAEGSAGGSSGWPLRFVSELKFLRDSIWITFAMLRAARSERAVVFHGNDLPTLPVTTWAARLAGGKALYDSHELWVGMSPETSTAFNAIARWVEGRYIRRMDAVVTVNHMIAEELRRRYDISLPSVVMNCPALSSAAPVESMPSIRTRFGIPAATPIVLYQGIYQPGRGLEALIDCGRYLTRGVIVLRGYGANEEALRRRVAEQRGLGRVIMVEPVPMADLVAAARESDIGIVPYTACTPCNAYALPNKLFEYMLAGLALAVSNLPVMEKLVRDHDLGVVFDPSNPTHIAEQLNMLIDNPARLRACRENAWRAARERYHWELEGGKLVTIYRRLAEEAAPRGATPD